MSSAPWWTVRNSGSNDLRIAHWSVLMVDYNWYRVGSFRWYFGHEGVELRKEHSFQGHSVTQLREIAARCSGRSLLRRRLQRENWREIGCQWAVPQQSFSWQQDCALVKLHRIHEVQCAITLIHVCCTVINDPSVRVLRFQVLKVTVAALWPCCSIEGREKTWKSKPNDTPSNGWQSVYWWLALAHVPWGD